MAPWAHLIAGACLLAALVTNLAVALDEQQEMARRAKIERINTIRGETEDFSKIINDQVNKDVDLVLAQVSKQNLSDEDKLAELGRFGSVLDTLAAPADAAQNAATTGQYRDPVYQSRMDRFKSVFRMMRDKLVSLSGYMSRKFNQLKESTLKTKFGRRLRHGAKTIKLQLAKWPDFATFKAKFHKVYKSPREELFRQMVYLRTQSIVLVQHVRCLLRLDRHSLKATRFSDWTEEEFERKFDNKKHALHERDDVEPFPADEMELLRQLAKQKSLDRQKHVADNRSEIHPRMKRSTHDDSDDESDDDGSGESDDDDYDPMEIYDNEDMEGDEKMLDDDVLQSLRAKAMEEEDESSVHFDPDAMMTDIDELDEELDSLVNADNFEPVDLRSTGCVGPIKDQGNCGACFAFAATLGAEYHQCMADNGELTIFNPMFVSDCGNYYDYFLNGCEGGIVSKALRFIAHAGHYEQLVYEIFKSSSGNYDQNTCPFPDPPGETRAQKRVNLKNWARTQVTEFADAIFYALEFADWHTYLSTVGPIYINLANPRNFKDWGYGIYDGTANENDVAGIHTMLLVGHLKDENGKGYWLIGNSHGALWGDNGYLRLSDLGVERHVKLAIGMSKPGTSREKVKSLYRK